MGFGGKIEQGFHVYDSDTFLRCAGVSQAGEKRSSKGTVGLSPHLERLRGGRSESEILSLVVKSIRTEMLQFPPQKGHCTEPGGMFGLTQMS